MAQALKKSVPGLTAAHLAAFTSVAEAPELHVAPTEFHGEVLFPQWRRTPAIVMRGWVPRPIERQHPFSERLADAAAAVVAHVREWHRRVRSRQALLRLDDRMLRDLGISRATAEYLGARPFWHPDK